MMERGRPYLGGPYPIIEGHIPSMPVAKSSTKQADPIGALHRFVHERRDAEIPRRVPTRWPPPMPMKGTPVSNPNKTLIAALLDRSGSMETSKKATEDGWRELVNEQRQQPGQCQVTLAQFDTVYEVLYSATDIAEVPEFVVQPRGMTALLDATGKFITEIGEQLSALPEAERPGHVICLIMTDGMENSSHEWDWEAVRTLIKQQRDQWNWKVHLPGSQHRRRRGRRAHGVRRRGLHHLRRLQLRVHDCRDGVDQGDDHLDACREGRSLLRRGPQRSDGHAEEGQEHDEVGPRPRGLARALACPPSHGGMQGPAR